MSENSKETEPASLDTIPSERLRQCFRSGGVVGLFPVLGKWSQEELKALLKDVELFHQVSLEKLDRKVKAWTKGLGHGQADNNLRAAVKHAHDTVAFRLMAVCSEVNSVAMYYIKGKK